MATKDTVLTILQVIALVLPTVAIYLQIVTTRNDLSDMDDGDAANYHAIRLTLVYLLIAGVVLIGSLLIFPMGSETLLRLSLVLLGLALVTFTLPVVFSNVGLSDSRSILWPYQNLLHRLQDGAKSSD